MDLKENYDRLKKLRSLHSDVAKMIAFEEKCIREKKRKKAKSDKEKLHTISETNSISGTFCSKFYFVLLEVSCW